MDPGVIPNSARKVMTVRLSSGVHTLWVSPTKAGGFCSMWTDFGGGCTQERVPPIARPSLSADLNSFLLGATFEVDEEGTTKVIGGRLLGDALERLAVEYEDGKMAEIPFVWVSPPIDAGFYLFEVPKPHRQHGHRVTALVASDADGDVVARQSIAFPRPEDIEHAQRLPDGQIAPLPANVLIEKARRLIDFRAENGNRITLWLIPRARGLPCHAFNRGGGCPPRPFDQALAGGLSGGERPVLFPAQVGEGVAQVELRYEDGTVERLEPVEGFVLAEIGSAHYKRGHRLVAAIARWPNAEVIKRQEFHADAPGIYPCEEPIDIGHGVMSCP
jgi:hypothetical protein